MLDKNVEKIILDLNLSLRVVDNTLQLLKDGATVPFIARYRKEATGSLDETMIIKIRTLFEKLVELDKRRTSILKSIREQEKLTTELEKKINDVDNLPELEDLYLPYKPKRKTRASVAIEKGLEPLAIKIFSQVEMNITEEAEKYTDPEKDLHTIDDVLSGARDIIAEKINEYAHLRSQLRNIFKNRAYITSKVIKSKKEEGIKYENYYNWAQQLSKTPSHRILAAFRGEKEGFLKISIAPLEEDTIRTIEKKFLKSANESSAQVKEAISDAYKRLIQPSLETEMRNHFKIYADEKAIDIFANNLRQLLMQPPLGQKRVLAIDPGFSTGCKIVILDETGQLLHNETIYPHPPQLEVKQALKKLETLVETYKTEVIAIGNGTAGRETEMLIKRIPFKGDVIAIMVNEAGASVYSASGVAREEFPDYDITVRGSVSIGRRLMDPLAELVKIDPKSIGVGQYQHDVNQKSLQKSLEETVISCVNQVGVDLNIASKELITYVSGIGPVLAKNIVAHRNENGKFKNREELIKVARFGEKVFQQSAGFLRIKDGDNILDKTAVHPESYYIVESMAKKLGVAIENLIDNKDKKQLLKKLSPEEFVDEKSGIPTITDIIKELDMPGRDPRQKYDIFEFDNRINTIEDIKPEMILSGIVSNITAFGAFIDIGIHGAGLVHISQICDRFISDPNEVLHINQKVKVKVINVDLQRKRVQLTMKGLQNEHP